MYLLMVCGTLISQHIWFMTVNASALVAVKWLCCDHHVKVSGDLGLQDDVPSKFPTYFLECFFIIHLLLSFSFLVLEWDSNWDLGISMKSFVANEWSNEYFVKFCSGWWCWLVVFKGEIACFARKMPPLLICALYSFLLTLWMV